MSIKTDKAEIVKNITDAMKLIIPYEYSPKAIETFAKDMENRQNSDWLYLLKNLTSLLVAESQYALEKRRLEEHIRYLNKQE